MATAEFTFPDNTGQLHTLTGQESSLRYIASAFLGDSEGYTLNDSRIKVGSTLVSIYLQRFGWSGQIYESSGAVQSARAEVAVTDGQVSITRLSGSLLTRSRPIRVDIYVRSG